MKQQINLFFSRITIFTLLAVLTACSTAPTHLIVAPELTVMTNHQYSEQQIQLSVVDMRTGNHIVQILKEGEAATILSSQQRLEEIISDTLTKAWKSQGLRFNELSEKKVKVTIDKAIISVNQNTMSYDTQSEIVLNVEVINTAQTLTNTFKIRSNSEGPLKADIAVLERDFNQQLSQVLNSIITSKDINDFL